MSSCAWATAAMAAGINPKVVQERLGHSDIAITLQTYSHVMPGMDRAAADAVAARQHATVHPLAVDLGPVGRAQVDDPDALAIDLDAPVLPAYEASVSGSVYCLVWCDHCGTYHRHGPAEGHREAHCNDPESPYWRHGYNLAYGRRL